MSDGTAPKRVGPNDDELVRLGAEMEEFARGLGLMIYPAGVIGPSRAVWPNEDDWKKFIELAPNVGATSLYLVVDPPDLEPGPRRFGRDDEEIDVRALHVAYVSPEGIVHSLKIFDQAALGAWNAVGADREEQSARIDEFERRAHDEGWTEKILLNRRYVGCPSTTRNRVVGELLVELDGSITPTRDSNLVWGILAELQGRLPDAKASLEREMFDSMEALAREIQTENADWIFWRVPRREVAAKKFLADRFGFSTAAAAGELARYKQLVTPPDTIRVT